MIMQRQNKNPALIDGLTADLGGPKSAAFFQRCDELIPWEKLAAPLEALYANNPAGGRPHWPVVLMLKCVMLEKWFSLSDPQLEELLQDRLSFRRFVGLSLTDTTPDYSTLSVFRARLAEAGKVQELFDQTVAVLRQRGLVLKTGTLVDATLIDAPMGQARPDGTHTAPSGATYTKNHGTLRYGYKAHIATDRRGLITAYVYDTAKVHDSRHFDQLIEGETQRVWADSAYRDDQKEADLAARGIKALIVHKRVRGQKTLGPVQKAYNRACSRVRAIVEHPRAWMSKMGYTTARYRNLTMNALDFGLMAIAYNWKRSFSLAGQRLSEPKKPVLTRVRVIS
jgi:IS5 family transposase